MIFLAFLLPAILGGVLRRLWGSSRETKEAYGFGFVRNSAAKAGVIALSFLLVLLGVGLGDWQVAQGVIILASSLVPWWAPFWGESNLAPARAGGRWPRWQGAVWRTLVFGLPAAIIAYTAGQWWFTVAGLSSVASYGLAWAIVPYGNHAPFVEEPTDVGEIATGALWFGALGVLQYYA